MSHLPADLKTLNLFLILIMGTYRCLECEEMIEHRCCCAKHHFETKHTKYELIETDIFLEIKSL